MQSSVGRVDLLKVGVDLERGTHIHFQLVIKVHSKGHQGEYYTSYTLYYQTSPDFAAHDLILLISYMSLYNFKSQAIRLTAKELIEIEPSYHNAPPPAPRH